MLMYISASFSMGRTGLFSLYDLPDGQLKREVSRPGRDSRQQSPATRLEDKGFKFQQQFSRDRRIDVCSSNTSKTPFLVFLARILQSICGFQNWQSVDTALDQGILIYRDTCKGWRMLIMPSAVHSQNTASQRLVACWSGVKETHLQHHHSMSCTSLSEIVGFWEPSITIQVYFAAAMTQSSTRGYELSDMSWQLCKSFAWQCNTNLCRKQFFTSMLCGSELWLQGKTDCFSC